MKKFVVKNLEDLQGVARELAVLFRAGDTIGFSGELGAGKTTLIQMLGREFGIKETMTSPTFVLRKEYALPVRFSTITKIVHIDAYRIEGGSAEDLGSLAEPDAVTLIEWPERLPPEQRTTMRLIRIEILPDEARHISIAA